MVESDIYLWNKIKNGDINALGDLYNKYYYQLYLYAKKLYNNVDECEDAVSECFIKLWNKKEALVIDRALKTYLYLIIRNDFVDKTRQKKESIRLDDLYSDIPDEGIINECEKYAELYTIMERMPDQRLAILKLATFDSLTYAQIAKKFNISINTVKTQMGRAYKFLKEELDKKSFYD
jgi:RNA polymerase sigma-70 factor (ECF subfamily)